MRVLLLTLYFHPDSTAANAVITTGLAAQMVKYGHEVTVLTSFPHYDRNVIDPTYRGRLYQQSCYLGMRVVRTYIYTSAKKKSIIGRLFSFLSWSVLSTVAGIMLAGNYDLIIAPSPPLTIGLTAWLLGLLKRIPYVYNVQDIYPDIAVRLGILTSKRLIRFFRQIEDFIYRNAAAVTVLSDGFRSNLLKKGVPENKLYVIPNFVDSTFMSPKAKNNEFSRQYCLHNSFVLMYAGNVGLSQDLDTALQVANNLQDLPDFRLLIVGNGVAKAELEVQSVQNHLTNVLFLPYQPRELLPDMYATADVCLVSLRRAIGIESVPSKTYTIMASGRPILAAVCEDSETKKLIEEAKCGLWVPPEDPQSLAKAIRKLYHDPKLRNLLGHNGRVHVEKFYTPEVVARKYIKLFERLVPKTSQA